MSTVPDLVLAARTPTPHANPRPRRRLAVLLTVLLALATGLVGLASPATAYPTCSSSSSDPDGDGWGWENNQSCQVAATSYPTCSSSSSDPDGDGWGWENNQSCKVSSGGGSTGGVIGLHVSGGRLVEADGTPFVMRGVNHAHAWFSGRTSAISDIGALGANTVRIVLSNGDRWGRNSESEVQGLVATAKSARLISVLEVHDTTGYGEDGAATTLSRAVDYWISIKGALIGQEKYVMLNIGNEPYGNTGYGSFAQDTTNAINRLRAAGIKNSIVVDAPNWGQDWSGTMRNSAASILNADPQKNVVFDVHMYGVYDTWSEVSSYMAAYQSAGVPLIVGEFGHWHSDGDPHEDAIMAEARSRGIGWIAWSWDGNSGGVEYLDLVNDWNRGSLTWWGNRIVHGADGISATSQRARVFG